MIRYVVILFMLPVWTSAQTLYIPGTNGTVSGIGASSNGSIGIGTATPEAAFKLDVRGGGIHVVNSATDGYTFVGRDNAPGSDSYFYHRMTGSFHIIGSNKNNSGSLRSLGFAIGGDDLESDIKMSITASGNVGIGESAPDFRLNLKDGFGGRQLKFQRGTGIATILQDNNTNNLYIDAAAGLFINSQTNGNVGIGTNSPQASLHVKANVPWLALEKSSDAFEQGVRFTQGNTPLFYIYTDNDGSNALKIQSGTEGDGTPRMQFPVSNKDIYMAQSGGNVGIGTSSPDAMLTVKGDIHTREVRVDLEGPLQVPDYVFEKDYNLLSLTELETYINANKHLPEVPSAKEMEANGLNLKEMNLLLLKKVEELTLHLIEANKKIDNLDKQVQSLKKSGTR